jgi:hypothetical protein
MPLSHSRWNLDPAGVTHWRDADLLPMYDFTTNRLQAELTEEEWEAFGTLTFENPEIAQKRVAATAHAIDPAEIYSAAVIRDLIGESAH